MHLPPDCTVPVQRSRHGPPRKSNPVSTRFLAFLSDNLHQCSAVILSGRITAGRTTAGRCLVELIRPVCKLRHPLQEEIPPLVWQNFAVSMRSTPTVVAPWRLLSRASTPVCARDHSCSQPGLLAVTLLRCRALQADVAPASDHLLRHPRPPGGRRSEGTLRSPATHAGAAVARLRKCSGS